MKKYLSLLIIITMISTLIPSYATKVVEDDITGHWAEATIRQWQEKELIMGYPDGTFRPDHDITKVEFITLVNRIYGYYVEADENYTDVVESLWCGVDCKIAKANGYMDWHQEDSLHPLESILREEVFAILAIIMQVQATEDLSGISRFTDKEDISDWSVEYIDALASNGYIEGNTNQAVESQDTITRAEAVTMLDRVMGRLINKLGTYGADDEAELETIAGNLTVNSQDVILQNMIIEGDLILAAGIEDGDVDLINVTVKGRTIINGGGENSITITGSNLGEVRVYKIDGKIRVVLAGSEAENVILKSGGKLEGEYGDTEIVIETKEGQEVILEGNFESIVVDLEVDIQVMDDSTVGEMTFNAIAEVTGKGEIDKVILNASGVKIEQKVKDVVIGIDISGVEEEIISSGGTSGGGSTYSKSNQKSIISTNIGNIYNTNIIDVPTNTKVEALKAGLTVSEKATVEIIDGAGGNPVLDQTSTDVLESMIIQVTAENGTKVEYTITFEDLEAPTVISYTPINTALDINTDIELQLTFNENVQLGSGSIMIRKASDDSIVAEIQTTDTTQITKNENTVTINPTVDLKGETEYYVVIDDEAIKDIATIPNKYIGITDKTTWTFTTKTDEKAPLVTSYNPLDNEDAMGIDESLEITFDENIEGVSGKYIKIYKENETIPVQEIEVIDLSKVTITNNKVVIQPDTLEELKQYYILIDQGAFKDKATISNEYAGIIGKTTWNFATKESTPPVYSKVIGETGDIEREIKFTVEINENGKVYYAITDEQILPKPSAGDLKNKNIPGALQTGEIDLTANEEGTKIIQELIPEKEYYIYLVVEDISNNFADVQELSATAKLEPGNGSEANPFKIWSIEDLAKIGTGIGTDGWGLNDNYKLMSDLDFYDSSSYKIFSYDYITGLGWEPIGNYDNRFTGNFDGNDKTIEGLYINRPSQKYIGIFGVSSGKITDLGNLNIDVRNYHYGVGGIVGRNSGTIESCYSTGDITAGSCAGGIAGFNYGTIENSYSTAKIVTEYNDAGGIAGENEGTIKNSYSTGDITARDNAGGVVGYHKQGTIKNCYSEGAIKAQILVGGIAGASERTIENSYSTGSITAEKLDAGGIVGGNWGPIKNSYSIGDITAEEHAGGIVGGNYVGTIENSCAYNNKITAVNYVSRIFGYNMKEINIFKNNFAKDNMNIRENSVLKSGASNPNTEWGADIDDMISTNSQTLLGWDFINIWEIKPGANRPTLRNVGNDNGE